MLNNDFEMGFFVKELPEYSTENIAFIFKKSEMFFEISGEIEGLITPKPISYSNDSIKFERIHIGTTLYSIIRDGNDWDPVLLDRIANYLARLHLLQKEDSMNLFVLGDFAPGNISIPNNSICFFDFQPPPGLQSKFNVFYRNSYYHDLATFILWLWISYPLRKVNYFFQDRSKLIKIFLKQYFETTGYPFCRDELSRHLKNVVNYRQMVINNQKSLNPIHRVCLKGILNISSAYQVRNFRTFKL